MNDTTQAPRRPPSVVITITLEESPTITVVADSFEDEQRVRVWAARAVAARIVRDALDDLADRRRAA